jgi:class 3 adenylate cyclase
MQHQRVNASGEDQAWLETPTGERCALQGSCSLGRTAVNMIVLESPKVSRRHALIHLQNIGEFWLIDFGSSNGTFLNKRRIHQPVRLNDGDQIIVGDKRFKFCQPTKVSGEYKTMVTQRTLREVANIECWLLLADIRNFTPLAQSMRTEGLETLVGNWLSDCKNMIEKHGGEINKYLGDGFLAYWRQAETPVEEIAAVITELKQMQTSGTADFRVVIHLGPVAVGGVASLGEESLLGKEVNFIFRLEKLAGSLDECFGLSGAAQAELKELVSTRPLGNHRLKGFEGDWPFFAV